MNYYEKWDLLGEEKEQFNKYVIDNYNKIYTELKTRQNNYSYFKTTTYPSNLGIASPSKFTKYMVGKYQSGRIIKNIKPEQAYHKIYFDENDLPICIEEYNTIESGDYCSKGDTIFFTEYKGNIWTACFQNNGNYFENGMPFKIVKSDNGRLLGLYEIRTSVSTIVYAEEYDYSEIDSNIVWCTYSSYSSGLSGSSKDVPAGAPHSPLDQWKYKIYLNEKGKYTEYDSFFNENGEFVFIGHYKC